MAHGTVNRRYEKVNVIKDYKGMFKLVKIKQV